MGGTVRLKYASVLVTPLEDQTSQFVSKGSIIAVNRSLKTGSDKLLGGAQDTRRKQANGSKENSFTELKRKTTDPE